MAGWTAFGVVLALVLACGATLRTEAASVSREELLEEHLLPVRVPRATAEEGSGDVDAVPIQSLRSGMLERMVAATEEEEEDRSVESIETNDEGSGMAQAIPRAAAVTGTDGEEEEPPITTGREEMVDATTATPRTTVQMTTMQQEGSREVELTTNSEESTAATTETATATTAQDSDKGTTMTTTTVRAVEDTTIAVRTEEATTTAAKSEKEGTTTAGATEPVPTTLRQEDQETERTREEVTEVVRANHVQPAFVAPETTAAKVATTTTTVGTETGTEGETKTEAIITTTTTAAAATVTTTEEAAVAEGENATADSDTLLTKIKSRLLDESETVAAGSKDPSRLGTYIVVSLILLSFLSLIGFLLMKRRVQKRRKKANLDPETLDTEKALLSLSEYKDHPDGVDEGKIKNNEITPIVIKSNSQINKFEKNTNFSSPKNLNTKANEKNVEKENVLRKTSPENLTQVIIEDAAKDVDEDKVSTNADKLIVRTHLDPDSIPKKPVIVNRTSVGCLPVTQD